MADFEYVKRYQMLFDFDKRELPDCSLPTGYFWVPWHASLTDDHARTQYISFRNELDALIFPTFTRFDACLRLMRQIATNVGFLPKATWLIARRLDNEKNDYCATIQGLRQGKYTGGIQNVAVRPEFRRQGLGRALVCKALEGFRESGCSKITLEATAENLSAIRLYQKIGFEVIRTTYKETCFLSF